VLICMERNSDTLVITRAQTLAKEMFDQIGVALVWSDLKHCPETPRPIVIRLSVDTPHEVLPRALAVSYPFEGVHIRVFYDRVRAVTPSCPLDVLLAHVLAHEISHMLEGTDWHSPGGMMKNRWDRNDFARMARQPLPFTDLDVQLIHWGLDARADRPSGDQWPNGLRLTLRSLGVTPPAWGSAAGVYSTLLRTELEIAP